MTRAEAKVKAQEYRDAVLDLDFQYQHALYPRVIERLRHKVTTLEQDLYEWDIEDLLKDEDDDETIPITAVPAA